MSENQVVDAKESFISYLNNEIDQIREDIKMPGWTNWAILAALASIVWLIILEIEKNVFNFDQIFLLYIILSLTYFIFRDIYDFAKPNQANRKIRFLTTDVLLRENKFAFIINIAQASLVVILLIHFSTQVGTFTYYLSLFFYGMMFFSPILLFLIDKSVKSFTHTNFYIPDSLDYPISFSSPSLQKKFTILMSILNPSLFINIIILYASIKYSLLYFNLFGITINPATFSSLKIAILTFSIFLLIKVWIHNEQISPTLKELVEIRRDLMFGNINTDMAKKLAEISISGLNKSAIIQREIGNCILTLQGIDTELNKATQKNQIASAQYQTNNENPESQQVLWETIRDATLVHLRQARTIYLSDRSLRGGLVKFLRIYAPIEPNDTSFVDSLRKMAELFREVKEKYDQTIYEWLQLIDKYEGHLALNKWKKIAIKELEAELPQQEALEIKTG